MEIKIRHILLLLSGCILCACHNGDISFDDYERQTVYFPYQYPVRTLSLGNDTVDNSLDLAHEFNIGICVGGYYGNSKQDWAVDYTVDESMASGNLENAAGDLLKPLPASYYTLDPPGQVTIKKGTSAGLIRVHLTDEFFDDPLALKGCYVIPLRITAAQSPLEILDGTAGPNITDPNRHDPADWEKTPMDYTLFGIKYVNKFHGHWLRRGLITERDGSGAILSRISYHHIEREYDEIIEIKSVSLNSFTVSLQNSGNHLDIKATDDGSDYLDIESLPTSDFKVNTGSGLYRRGSERWGGTPEKPTKRDGIYLNLFYKNAAGHQCEVSDTLVFRDRGIVFENARPTLK